MQPDFIIVGQGIAGSLLYYKLSKAGASCVVIDDNNPNSSSRVAAGLINPVTGRRLVKSWMIDELLPALKKIYGEIEKDFKIQILHETELTWHLPATDIVEAFDKRLSTQTEFLAEANTPQSQPFFHFPFKAGNINPCFIVDVHLLLSTIRKKLEQAENLLNEKFDHQWLSVINTGVRYKDLQASKIIFCEGSGAINNPLFRKLPYSLNKGEALIVSVKDLPADRIYKFKQTLVPLPGKENLWWYGSNYTWHYDDERPTSKYRSASEKELQSWLKIPFSIVDHKAAVRYATVERRPFVGFHPNYPSIGIFNGWGTKGCSLVPYFAEQLADFMLNSSPINPEADVKRFGRILLGN